MSFVAFCEERGADHMSADLAIEWATQTTRGSSDDYQRYLDAAELISKEVFGNSSLLGKFLTCTTQDDMACVKTIVTNAGLKIFRRPLSNEEITTYSKVYTDARAVGDSLADLDRTDPEPMRRPEVPRPGNKYAWLVGILAFMGLSVLLFANTLPNTGKGINGPEPGSRKGGQAGGYCVVR